MARVMGRIRRNEIGLRPDGYWEDLTLVLPRPHSVPSSLVLCLLCFLRLAPTPTTLPLPSGMTLTTANGRDKVICVNKLESNQVARKVELLLNASGAKLRNLKNATLEPGPGGEAARGIWSALHDATKPAGGYRI